MNDHEGSGIRKLGFNVLMRYMQLLGFSASDPGQKLVEALADPDEPSLVLLVAALALPRLTGGILTPS